MLRAARVVITGLGLVLPHGAGLESAEGVFGGRSAVVRLGPWEGLEGVTGAPAMGFTPLPGTENADRAVQFAAFAADEAWRESGLVDADIDRGRVAVLVSLSKGGMANLARLAAGEAVGDPAWAALAPDAAARTVAARLGARGPVAAPVTACASGGHALIWGARLLMRGAADVAVVGAAEASLCPMVIGSYRRMGVLAPAGDDPGASVRPFSRTRRGFAIGEGAGVLVLESGESAVRREERVLAEVAGWASGNHAAGLTDLEVDGSALAHLVGESLRRAGANPGDVDYIHAHGTATPVNDLAEARAIRAALGASADGVSVSSTKGAHGHLLGAATAAELVLTVLAMGRGEVPPTANLTDPDPAIDLDCTPLASRRRRIGTALKIASGFGGHSLAVCLRGAGEAVG